MKQHPEERPHHDRPPRLLRPLFRKFLSLLIIIGFFAAIVLLLDIRIDLGDSSHSLFGQSSNKENVNYNPDTMVKDEDGTVITLETLENTVKDIGELSTVEYMYTNADKYENEKSLWIVKYGKSYIIARWDGIIKAGIQVQDIKFEINDKTNEITVKLPEATILSHEIDEDSFETLDEKSNLFNPIKADALFKEFVSGTKDAMEEKAVESGILEKANKSAKDIVASLLQSNDTILNNYTLIFK